MRRQFEIEFNDLNEETKARFLDFIEATNGDDFPLGPIAIIEIDETALR